MLDAAQRELAAAGVSERPGVLLADAGYWHQHQMERIIDRGIAVLIPPDASKRKGARRGWEGGYYAFHAPCPRRRPGQRALPATPTDDRAGVRPHQVQSRHEPLPTTRTRRRAD